MSNSPKISVVIATYNRAGFLPETINSVIEQKFKDFELIIVDDGSTDNTREVLRAFGGRLKYLYQQNRGPSAARNLGVMHSQSPWIAIQDSDDICAPGYLDVLYHYVASHPDCGMVFANGSYLSGPEHSRDTIVPVAKSRRLAESGIHLEDLFDKSIVRLQAALISKACYDGIGGHDESLRISMDLDLAFRLYAKFPIAYLDEVVFFYRKHDGNIGRNQELRLLENIRVIEKLISENPQAEGVLGKNRISARLAYRYYRLAKGRWKHGDRQGARHALRRAIDHRPLSLKYRAYELLW